MSFCAAAAAGILLCGCAAVPGNSLLLTEGQGKLMKEVMERKDKIISLSRREADRGKPVLLLLPGATEDPTEMMDIAREWRGDYNVFLYSYNYHERVEKVAADLTSEMTRLKTENHGKVTVLVYCYSAIVFREAVILGGERTLFADASLIQLAPTAGGSHLARAMKFPVLAFFVALASHPSAAENPYGRFAEKLWDGAGNKKFYEVINPQRMQTFVVEGDTHSLAGVRDENVQRRYKNGIGPNVVVIPASAGVTHEYFPTQPAGLEYLKPCWKFPINLLGVPLPRPGQKT